MSNSLPNPVLDLARSHAQRYLDSLATRHLGAQLGRREMVANLRAPFPEEGEPPAAVIDLLASQAESGMTACSSPRYFGFVIGGTHPVALAADWLVSTWDQNAGIHAISPFSAAVEEVAAEWILELFDLPRESSVGFVTGGQMANFTCLAAARHSVLRRVGWDVEADGLASSPPVNIIVGADAHVTIDVALRYLGFGTRTIVRVDSDDQGRMRADSLRASMRTLDGPTIICAQAGNVNSGSFDPLQEIAEVAKAANAWLHVDSAFGLWARATGSLSSHAAGIELADSWATDAHKWLNVPYDSGLAIVKHAIDHRAAMSSSAAYLIQTEGAERDAIDWVPELSRRARAIPVYATLRSLGLRGVAQLIEGACARARQIADVLAGEAGIQILNDVVLNQVLVRFDDDDDMTRAVVVGVQNEGTCWLSGTNWRGEAAMRVSVSNWATSEEDIARSAASIIRVYRGLQNSRGRATVSV